MKDRSRTKAAKRATMARKAARKLKNAKIVFVWVGVAEILALAKFVGII